MFSKGDLCNFFKENCSSMVITKSVFVSEENFSVDIKCSVEQSQNSEFYSQYVRDWIMKFSKLTATAWIVRNCFPKLTRLLYRKTYACHRSCFNKTKKVDHESRNQDCKAKIDFRVKFINRNTIKNDNYLKDGLNMTISINFVHSHKVRTPDAVNLLRITSETDAIFQKYFDSGCSRTAAKSFHELTLIDKYESKNPQIFANATINPTMRHITYLHGKKRKEHNEQTLKDIMEEKKEALISLNVDFEYVSDMSIAVVITPLMKRVVGQFGANCVIIDSTVIPNGPTATFLFVPTKVGALPIACAFHENDSSFGPTFELIKTHLVQTNIGTFNPKMLLLSDYENQNTIAFECNKHFSRYSLCIEIWRWLNSDDSKIPYKSRHLIMCSAKALIYSQGDMETSKLYENFREKYCNEDNPNLEDYFENIYNKRDVWKFDEDEHNFDIDLVELSIRYLKEFLVQKCKSFPMTIMVDVVVKILENYYKRIVSCYVSKLSTNVAGCFTNFLDKSKVVLAFASEVRRLGVDRFRVATQTKPKRHVNLRTDTMLCDCARGRSGNLCEHLCAIVNVVDCNVLKSPALTDADRKMFTEIAGEAIFEIKPELDVHNEVNYEDNDGTMDEDETDNIDNFSIQVDSEKSENNEYFYLEIKTERLDSMDPLEENQEIQLDSIYTENNVNNVSRVAKSDRKAIYETALKALNDEFRRLNRFFSENPNDSNLATMTCLAKEMSKIKIIERVNLDNLSLKMNENKKRKQE